MPFRIELSDPVDEPLDTITELISLEAAVAFNTVGRMTFTIPEIYDMRFFRMDMRLRLYIDEPYLKNHLFGDTVWLLNKVGRKDESLTITAVDANDILNRALIAYTSETLYADKTIREMDIAGLYGFDDISGNYGYDPYLRIDNMMRAYVSENISVDVLDAERNNPFVTVEDWRSLAPLGEKEASYNNLLSTLQELARQSEDKGTPLYFNLSRNGANSFIFRVWSNQPNTDRSSTSISPTVLLEENGDLVDVEETYDWSEAGNVGYGLGLGAGSGRVVVSDTYPPSLRTGPFSRREFTVDLRDADQTDWMLAEVGAALQGKKPRVRVAAKVGEGGQALYGRDFVYGDKIVIVTGYDFYRQYDVYISAAQAQWQNNRQAVNVSLTGVDFLES